MSDILIPAVNNKPIHIDYDTLNKLYNLNNRKDSDNNDFGFDTCCDYVDSITFYEKNIVEIVMFVEPCGNISKIGITLSEVLDWWIEVFKTQPKEWDYIRAGWYLYNLNGLPDDPKEIWNAEMPK